MRRLSVTRQASEALRMRSCYGMGEGRCHAVQVVAVVGGLESHLCRVRKRSFFST